MNAGGGERSGRIHGGGESPIVARQLQKLVLAKIAVQQHWIAKLAGRKQPAQLDHSGLETSFVADAKLHARLLYGADGGFGVGRRRA